MSIRCLCYTVIKTLFHCVTAHLHTKIYIDVLIEPHLQPVPLGNSLIGASVNMLEGARLVDAMNGFWGGRYNRTLLTSESLTHMLNPAKHLFSPST